MLTTCVLFVSFNELSVIPFRIKSEVVSLTLAVGGLAAILTITVSILTCE